MSPSKKPDRSVEVTEDVYMSKYDKISEEKFKELEDRIAALESIDSPGVDDSVTARLQKLEEFERQAKNIKGWFPLKWK